jgi:predicted N-acetyltransferase YhbS
MIQEELAEDYQCGYASCKLIPFTEKGMPDKQAHAIRWMTNLTVDAQYRRKGLASNLLKQLGKEADQAQVAILVEVRPIEGNITQESLEAMYKKHGYISVQDEPKLMMRVPVPAMLFEQLSKKPTSQIITNLYN